MIKDKKEEKKQGKGTEIFYKKPNKNLYIVSELKI